MKTYYKPHAAPLNSKNEFNSFLDKCKYAMNKVFGYNMSVKCDEWSILLETGRTVWEELKATGKVSVQNEFYTIDFDYEAHVYVELK
jgi:hypothetical protein